MLDGLRSLDCYLLLLFFGEGWKQLLTIIDKETFRLRDKFTAIQAISLPFLCTDNFATTKAVINKVMLLCHAVTFYPLHIDLFGSSLLLLHQTKIIQSKWLIIKHKFMIVSNLSIQLFSKLILPATHHTPSKFTGSSEQILAKRLKYFPKAYPHSFKNPLVITEGYMQYLYDHKGNRYLDLDSNDGQVNIGHNHPAIQKVIQDQADRLIHTSIVLMSETQGEYSKLILDQLGPQFETVYLCNSSGQAIDLSLMLSLSFTNCKDIYAFKYAHHGLVGNGNTVSNLGTWSSPSIERLPCVRLDWLSVSADSEIVLKEVQSIVNTNSSGYPGTLVYEPIQTKSGVHLARNNDIKQIVQYFKSRAAVTICDQTSTGMGRIGNEIWGFKSQKHVPDVVVLGSSLGNGHPLSAVVTRKQIADTMSYAWFNTCSAGHMQTKIGIAVLNALTDQKLNQNSQMIGNFLLAELKKIVKQSKFILEVRGKGLLIGMDIINKNQPSKQKALQIMQLARERQLLVGRGGVLGNVILIRPPLCLSLDDAKYIVQTFDDILHHL